MVMLAEPLDRALEAARQGGGNGKAIYLSPQGSRLDHRKVMELAKESALTLLCGRYEGVDERLLARRVDEELSLGDFVLSGGELAAMALIDAVVRQLPGALGDEQSALEESFADGLLDCPQYTRPEVYQGARVPEELLSGTRAPWYTSGRVYCGQSSRPSANDSSSADCSSPSAPGSWRTTASISAIAASSPPESTKSPSDSSSSTRRARSRSSTPS